MATTAHFTVSGMTCQHCVASVTEEVGEIDAVTAVEVDLASGGLSVTSDTAIAEADISSAVTEAGYTLVAAD